MIKYVWGLYAEHYKTSVKNIKDDLDKQCVLNWSLIVKIGLCQVACKIAPGGPCLLVFTSLCSSLPLKVGWT
jgi:hypothetical protein